MGLGGENGGVSSGESAGCVLLIDTCGQGGGVALAEEGVVSATRLLPEKTASAGLLQAVGAVLGERGRTLAQVSAVGVVAGPGSFTGVRVGLAAAKGFCESLGVPLAAVSRLAVLAEAAGLSAGYALLDAGRGEVYVREVGAGDAREFLLPLTEVAGRAQACDVVAAEASLVQRLNGLRVRLQALSAADALGPVLRCLAEGGSEVALVDANYVRGESEIYRKQASMQGGSLAAAEATG